MDDLMKEADRCLKCKNPRCKYNCPINTEIPDVITLFQDGKLHEAGKMLFDNNPLAAITSIVCPHEDQCKGNCIVGIKGEPVSFCDIERYVSYEYLKELTIEKAPYNGKKIAVIGSGPAGITASILLAQKGYGVTLFELKDDIGGVLKYGIPDFRLHKDIIDMLEEKLVQLGVRIRPNTLIGPVLTMDKLFYDGYDAIFIGTGVWRPKPLNIKGESLGHCSFAIDYLKNPSKYRLGDKTIVIGAGNVAMDAARSAKHYGKGEVSIYYRRSEADMPATRAEIKETKHDGVEFHLFKSPIEITDEGVVFVDTKQEISEDGKKSVVVVEGTEELVKCDNVIIAVSQAPQANIVNTSPELKTSYGLIITDEHGNTSKKGVFACGDVVSGAKTVLEAVVAAKDVVNTIDEYCNNL